MLYADVINIFIFPTSNYQKIENFFQRAKTFVSSEQLAEFP